jgi:hypothetical protein
MEVHLYLLEIFVGKWDQVKHVHIESSSVMYIHKAFEIYLTSLLEKY